MSATRLPALFLIADVPTLGAELAFDVARAVMAASPPGAVAVVDRDRPPGLGGSSDRDRLERLQRWSAICRQTGGKLVVSARPDLALLAGAFGVQLPETGLPAQTIRATFPALAVGRSCHDREGLLAAARDGATWAFLSPVHDPISKPAESPALGVPGFGRVIAGLSIPVLGLGGIDDATSAALAASGASGVAAIGHVFRASDPISASRALLNPFREP